MEKSIRLGTAKVARESLGTRSLVYFDNLKVTANQ